MNVSKDTLHGDNLTSFEGVKAQETAKHEARCKDLAVCVDDPTNPADWVGCYVHIMRRVADRKHEWRRQ